jgi:uncharacterized protein (DUF58 family)
MAPATLARLERLVCLARRVGPSTSRRPLLRRIGRGVEPGGRRDYTPGDDLRFVDWPAYARLERLLIKVHEELPHPSLDLILDGSASMACGDPSPSLRAALASAALAACAVAREVRVVLWWAGDPLSRFQLHRPGQLVNLLRFLAERTPAGDASHLDRCAARLAEISRVRGAAVILTDGLATESTASAATRLRKHGFASLVVVASSSREMEPSAIQSAEASGLAELIDAETGARAQVPFSRVALDLAARGRSARAHELAGRLDAAGIPLETLASDASFEAVALGLLRQR